MLPPRSNNHLLEELVERWDDRSGGFAIQGRIIQFTPLDVCFALGLRIIGELQKRPYIHYESNV